MVRHRNNTGIKRPPVVRLLVISHTPHYRDGDQTVGWGPTIREIDHLATLFEETTHLAPLHDEPPPASSRQYKNTSVRYVPVPFSGGRRSRDKLAILLRMPGYLTAIRREMRRADLVHIRCPAAISLMALVSLLFWGPPCRWVKYAGNWKPGGDEPWSYRLQRRLLLGEWHRSEVTVNGEWPDQPAHIHSFFNPSMTRQEATSAGQAAANRPWQPPFELLYVGALEKKKGVLMLPAILEGLITAGQDCRLSIVGDGTLRGALEDQIAKRGLQDQTKVYGWQSKDNLEPLYARAHLLLFPSLTEGWPKVLSEAMSHGVIPLASDVSGISQVLAKGPAGKTVAAGDEEAFLAAALEIIQNRNLCGRLSRAATATTDSFTYETYLAAVSDLARSSWNISLMPLTQVISI